MTVADTSALISVLMREADGPTFAQAIRSGRPVLVSTATAVEFLIVALGKGEDVYQSAIAMLGSDDIELVPLDDEQVFIASQAYQRYGKGRHPAGLNFGDTFAYALAAVHHLPLLFKGDDFARTDVASAI